MSVTLLILSPVGLETNTEANKRTHYIRKLKVFFFHAIGLFLSSDNFHTFQTALCYLGIIYRSNGIVR